MIKSEQCFVAICDECELSLNPSNEGTIHFATAEEARHEIEQYYEWATDGDRDLCDQCAAKKLCAELGHIPAIDNGIGGRYCNRCEEELS